MSDPTETLKALKEKLEKALTASTMSSLVARGRQEEQVRAVGVRVPHYSPFESITAPTVCIEPVEPVRKSESYEHCVCGNIVKSVGSKCNRCETAASITEAVPFYKR